MMDPAQLVSALPAQRHLLITGGTGFVGTALVAALHAGGHRVTVLTRDRSHAAALPDMVNLITSLDAIAADSQIDAVINLAGEPIAAGLWTKPRRARIIASRVDVTRACASLIARLETKPAVFISGSAIGWYGLNDGEQLDETSHGNDCFSRQVCLAWEAAAAGAACRTVLLRTGLVLGPNGGLLARMLPPFRLGLGGPFGKGENWMSWIHRDDLIRLIAHAVADPALSGPVNATAPHPVTGYTFAKALGRAIKRPVFLSVPAAPLRLVLGDFAEELLLGGQRVLPAKAEHSGFTFEYPELDPALAQVFGR
ncbi:MAG: TIGR01777 family oxidoreductase [Novosphingobium sp.]|uniref:TIGR01777 family oxidoreductase n=1 Tax=Novosphingobium sp. TaxID=1874826 RepID=UPI003C7E6C8E